MIPKIKILPIMVALLALSVLSTLAQGSNPPAISVQPSSQFVYSGNSVSLGVAATGASTLSFQWRKNNVTLASGGNNSGTTTSNLVLNPAQAGDGGNYSVVIQNTFGSITSSVAKLTVVFLPAPQNLFEADAKGKIYELTPTGEQSTFASGLQVPFAMAFNAAGDLFVADQGPNCIYEFTPSGQRKVFVTGLHDPSGLAFDETGRLFESDWGTSNIFAFTTNGVESTLAAGLDHPEGLAFDTTGNLLIANQGALDGTTVTKIFLPGGSRTTFASGLDSPDGLAVDSFGDLFVANQGPIGAAAITEITAGGMQTNFATGMGSLDALAFNSSGNLFIADAGNGTINVFTTNGVESTFATGLSPMALAFQPLVSASANLIDLTYGTGAGSFELGTYNTNLAKLTATNPISGQPGGLNGGWSIQNVGGSTISGWICNSNVDWDWQRWPVADGSKSIELGTEANSGSIYTTLPLNAGTTYTVTFALSATPGENPGIVQAALGTSIGSYTNSAATSYSNMQWETNTLSFTPGTNGNYQLQFFHPLIGSVPDIDAVSVSAAIATNPPPLASFIIPVLQMPFLAYGDINFSWNALPAYPPVKYQLQSITNLLSGWTDLGAAVTNNNLSVAMPAGSSLNGFYRLLMEQ